MPTVTINNTQIYYEDSAPNDTTKPTLLFSHGLLWSTRLYDNQVNYFKDKYRCIAYDHRGQGQSSLADDGYDMDTLAEDAMALITQLGIKSCHFIGLSMGGFVGLRLALRYPEALQSLILLDSSANSEPKEVMGEYNKLVVGMRDFGMASVSEQIMLIMFGQTFLTDKSRKAEYDKWKKYVENNNPVGSVRATQEVIDRIDIYDQIHKIKTPTLIGVGIEDVALPYKKSESMHFAIAGSKLAVFNHAGHTSTIEEPEQVNAAIDTFLTALVTVPA